jgi:guanylate kinase
MISPELQKEFDIARVNETNYWPSDGVQEALLKKDLVMVVGPSAIGKSTLMNKVVELDEDFSRVQNITSRPARSNDEPGLYEYISHTDEGIRHILDMIKKRELVQYAVHPTTKFVYATKPEGYPAQYNMLDTQAQVVSSLARLPFHKTHTVGLVSDPKAWQEWFLSRNKKGSEEYEKRIDEAIHSLEHMTAEPTESIHWIYNQPDSLEGTAKELIATVKGKQESKLDNRERAISMLYLAYQMKG